MHQTWKTAESGLSQKNGVLCARNVPLQVCKQRADRFEACHVTLPTEKQWFASLRVIQIFKFLFENMMDAMYIKLLPWIFSPRITFCRPWFQLFESVIARNSVWRSVCTNSRARAHTFHAPVNEYFHICACMQCVPGCFMPFRIYIIYNNAQVSFYFIFYVCINALI
jgi:hypothetical protein